jgi:caffeoyl-CoA O-methyltransferase
MARPRGSPPGPQPATAGLGALAAYADAHTTRPSPLLEELARETLAATDRPIMLSGPTVGRLLAILAGALRPRLAVDVGTFTGYSALCLAEGMPPGGRVVTLERDPGPAAIAARYFRRSPYRAKIELRVGDAVAALRRMRGAIGLAFLDAEKAEYWDCYDAIVERLAPTGVLVVDNTLMFGTVIVGDAAAAALPPPIQRQRAAIVDFNRRVAEDPRTEQCMLTVRDGVTLVRRRA